MAGKKVTIDGNQAAAHVAYAFSEVAAIYPITPSSNMGENADAWAAQGRKNLFGRPVEVIEMQSEAGAAGAVHGALSAGALTTTFTASQGLLLMIPNMYKIAGEMLPAVFHVSARSLACQSLSIFGDHSDVMSVRNTGFALLAANGIQETMDLALVSHLSTLKAQIPFLNFFDGFRTSHEIQKVEEIDQAMMASLLEPQYIEQFRQRALRPEKPTLKVAAQNPDVYFQGRETVNAYYNALPAIVQEYMDKVAAKTGRQYHLFDYVGAPDAEQVVIAMGSACDTLEGVVKHLLAAGAKVGLLKIHLYRPFSVKHFLDALPKTVKKIAVLDRTKEPGSIGEPLFQDVVTALSGQSVKIIGGRYGLSSKEFTPGMAKGVFDHLERDGHHGFTVGIVDDVTNLSITYDDHLDICPKDVVSCIFWGLGSDGTVGANKNSIKIIGDHTEQNAQGYFVYDSKKSYGITVSHLRFGKSSVNMPYLISKADFVACHNVAYLGRYDMLGALKPGGVFLLNSEIPTEEVFKHLTRKEQQTIIERKIRFYNIDALKIAEELGLGGRINTVMQAAFFRISGILPEDEAIELMKTAVKKAYGKKGEDIVQMNYKAIDRGAGATEKVEVPATAPAECYVPTRLIPNDASDFAKDVIEPTMHMRGDEIPVSKMSFDGSLPIGTSCLEKRGIGPRVPHWVAANCIQCNQCVMACPHAVVRAKQMAPADLKAAPEGFETLDSRTKNQRELKYRIQVYIEDCTGCGVCVETCPAKQKALVFSTLEDERAHGERTKAEFFDKLPDNVMDGVDEKTVKGLQFKKPLFEFSGACAGCGETPYVKMISQLYGDRMVVANATGCSSIYGGTFPTVPYCTNSQGRGPSWANSLFEDNAEYGFGMRLAVDSNRAILKLNVEALLATGTTPELSAALNQALALWTDKGDDAIANQIAIGKLLPAALAAAGSDDRHAALRKIQELKDYFTDKSVWIFGGDGWAYDIGYGGLDHVVASNRNVNIMVLDTEVYSNTGGQASKSTPIGAVAQFAASGMKLTKKNLPFMCMSYGYVYVASIALGADRAQALKAITEAEAYDGPSIVIAYAPCIAHGINMMESQTQMRRAVECGYWPLFRYNPTLEEGKRFSWDVNKTGGDFQQFIRSERRYTMLLKSNPKDAEALFQRAQDDAARRMQFFQKIGEIL